eukprot:scaffold167825_cov20-Tisochrysis_lutea.AAC.1
MGCKCVSGSRTSRALQRSKAAAAVTLHTFEYTFNPQDRVQAWFCHLPVRTEWNCCCTPAAGPKQVTVQSTSAGHCTIYICRSLFNLRLQVTAQAVFGRPVSSTGQGQPSTFCAMFGRPVGSTGRGQPSTFCVFGLEPAACGGHQCSHKNVLCAGFTYTSMTASVCFDAVCAGHGPAGGCAPLLLQRYTTRMESLRVLKLTAPVRFQTLCAQVMDQLEAVRQRYRKAEEQLLASVQQQQQQDTGAAKQQQENAKKEAGSHGDDGMEDMKGSPASPPGNAGAASAAAAGSEGAPAQEQGGPGAAEVERVYRQLCLHRAKGRENKAKLHTCCQRGLLPASGGAAVPAQGQGTREWQAQMRAERLGRL